MTLALLLTLVLFVSWKTLGPVVDEDVWYHMAIGRWIVEHRALPTRDVFAQPGDRPWGPYAPLWDSSIYLIHRAFGLVAIEVYRWATSVAAAVLACGLFHGRLKSVPLAVASTALVCVAIAPAFQERSWMVSILGFLATIVAVDHLRQGDRRTLLWLPPFFVVWANWHIQVMFGLMVLALAAGEDAFTQVFGARLGWGRSSASPARDSFALAGGAGLATLVHPMGWRLFALALSFRAPVKLQHWIEELHPPDFTEVSDGLVVALVGAALLLALRSITSARPRRIPAMELGMMALSLPRFLHYRRDGWPLAIVASAAAATMLPTGARARLTALWEELVQVRWARGLVWGGVVFGFVRGVGLPLAFPESRLEASVRSQFPERAVAEIERRQLPGPLFNDFSWGGYLMFALPRLPVATDSRMDVHSEDALELNILTWLGKAHDPALDRSQVILSERFKGLPDQLAVDPAWELVYSDELAQVFVRRAQP
jgi:hypothetical protein